MKTEFQKRVAKAKIEGIDNAYVSISAFYDEATEKLEKRMSFFYVASDNIIVEWEPEFGPITVITKCDENWKDDCFSARPHWYFDFCTGNQNWTQLEVDRRKLKPAYSRGDYEYIFAVLSEHGGYYI